MQDLVAQLVEHNTFNVRVLGSNPSQVTKKVSQDCDTFLFYIHLSQCPRGGIGRHAILRGWCSIGRAGSNPVVGTT